MAAGKFDDWPAADVASDRLGDEPWQPFDDAFTAELARAALWYCETFGLDIVRCHDELAAMTILPSGSRRRTDLNEWRKERLRGWSGGKLRPGMELAYEIVTGSTKSGKAAEMLSAWPPKLPRQVKRLVLLLQGAHAIIGFLSTAMRDGEMAELGRDCLEEVEDGPNLVGLTSPRRTRTRGDHRRRQQWWSRRRGGSGARRPDRPSPRRAELGADGVASAAEILAVGGSLALVRPGVLCTKAFNQFGPCSRKAGNPDVGSCQVDCTHRLELAAARSDAIRCIEQILEMLPAATGATRAWWSGQLKTQLARFDDVRARYEDDPRIGAALQHG